MIGEWSIAIGVLRLVVGHWNRLSWSWEPIVLDTILRTGQGWARRELIQELSWFLRYISSLTQTSTDPMWSWRKSMTSSSMVGNC